MITREQAGQIDYRDHVHYTGPSGKSPLGQPCTTVIGPRGGVKVTTIECRVNGNVQTWKTRPEEFRIPVKYGMREYDEVNHHNAGFWHLASECQAKYMKTLCEVCGWSSSMVHQKSGEPIVPVQHGQPPAAPCKYAPAIKEAVS